MKLILLRHFQRFSKPTFYTELTAVGKKNSELMVPVLSNYNIKHIFCSPFIRTIQSIEPFCKKSGLLINAENGLYESLDDCIFKNEYIYDIRNVKNKTHINEDYKSIVYKKHITYPDREEQVYARVKKFMKWLINEKNNSNTFKGDILCVSHQTTLYNLSKILNKPTKLNEGGLLIIEI